MTTFAIGDRVRVVGGVAEGRVTFVGERECRVDWYGVERTADVSVLKLVDRSQCESEAFGYRCTFVSGHGGACAAGNGLQWPAAHTEEPAKHRDGKRRWATHLPWLALGLVVDAFEAGLKDGRKPGDWKAAVRAPGGREVYRNALMRHAIGACSPEDSGLDDGPGGTGKLHLALAGANVLILLWYQLQDGGE